MPGVERDDQIDRFAMADSLVHLPGVSWLTRRVDVARRVEGPAEGTVTGPGGGPDG